LSAPSPAGALAERDVTLVDLADRLLARGVVLGGDIVLSVAGVDLVYVSLRAMLASIDTVFPPGAEGGK
jgi:hypothetical protein